MFGSIGSSELLLILVVALLVLGPKSLASTARSVGKVMGQFRRVSTDFQRTLNAEVAMEEEKEKRDKAAKDVEADLRQPVANAGDQMHGQTGSQSAGQSGTQAATATVKNTSDGNDEDDMLSPPPGSPLDEALKKTAAEAKAAGIMEPVSVETAQAAQSAQSVQAASAEQATTAPDIQGQQEPRNRA